ncbi:MAG: DUF481 domain-containing protein [Kiritimatiellae bacterium]|nr:DUF481 domain-containing protein [Kiritimatiellia bacterium]
MKRSLLVAMAAVLAFAVTASAAGKKKKAAPEPEESAFKTQLNASLTLTDGNSDTLGVNASLQTEGEKDGLGSILAGVEGNYAESESTQTDAEGNVSKKTETTVENAKAFFNVKKTLSELTFVGLNAAADYDDVALVDYRFTVGPTIGFYAFKTDTQSLDFEIGPNYVWEKVDGETDDYLALRFAERYSVQLTKTAKLAESVEYMPKADEFERYLLNAEASLDVAVSECVSVRLVVKDEYNSEPASGVEKNDLSVLAGLGITL